MGLLDAVLGSVLNQAGGRPGQGMPAGIDLGSVLGGLAGMMGGQGQPMPSQASQQAGMGGMGGLGGLLAGPLGAALLQSILGMVMNRGGGIGGMQQRFDQAGLGDVMQSWIGTGQNQPISGDQMAQVFGHDQVNDLAQRFGLSPDQVGGAMSQLMPEVIDRLTPHGQAPQAGFGGIEDALGALLGGRR